MRGNMNKYPKTLTGKEATDFCESAHIGSGDCVPIPAGNIALLGAIATQDESNEHDISVIIYNAHK
jgi:hypothetical protein